MTNSDPNRSFKFTQPASSYEEIIVRRSNWLD